MDFFETAEDVDRQIHRTRTDLERLEGDVSSRTAMSRLRRSYPYHPVLVGRAIFLVLAVACLIGVLGVTAAPYLPGVVDKEVLDTMHRLDVRMGVPLPVAIGAGTGLLFLAWVALSQAAVAIGRDCPLTPPEEKERDRLASELSRLTRQRQMMERAKAGTPRPVRRYETPGPGGAVAGPTPSYLGGPNSIPPEPARAGTPPVVSARPSLLPPSSAGLVLPPSGAGFAPAPPNNPAPPSRGGDGYARFRTPASVGREASPVASARPGRLVAEQPDPSARNPRGLVEEIETPTDQFADMPTEVAAAVPVLTDDPFGEPLVEFTDHDGGPDDPSYVVDAGSGQGGLGFDRRVSTELPAFAEVNEPWLVDAIDKAAVLAESFPIQARLEFNVDEHVPFTLVLERATPAMAVRAMMAFVEFLSTIATPRRARIELSSVAHLDRSFYRNVQAACEPYFADRVAVEHTRGQVDLVFQQPDSRWDRYPLIPTQS